jgi:hypothetical protein
MPSGYRVFTKIPSESNVSKTPDFSAKCRFSSQINWELYRIYGAPAAVNRGRSLPNLRIVGEAVFTVCEVRSAAFHNELIRATSGIKMLGVCVYCSTGSNWSWKLEY